MRWPCSTTKAPPPVLSLVETWYRGLPSILALHDPDWLPRLRSTLDLFEDRFSAQTVAIPAGAFLAVNQPPAVQPSRFFHSSIPSMRVLVIPLYLGKVTLR